MRLVVLVPTRGRPASAVRLLEAVRATAILPDTTVVFGVDEDDPERSAYEEMRPRLLPECQMPCPTFALLLPVPSRRGMVDGLNIMASSGRISDADVLMFMGDDHLPRTAGWDKALCDALEGKPAALAYGNDLLQGERIPTAVAMTASIPRALGYMAPPQLRHLYVDNVWRDWGEGIGALTYLPHVIIEHLHPAAGKAERDAGYEAVNATDVDSADKAAYLTYREHRLGEDVAKLRALT